VKWHSVLSPTSKFAERELCNDVVDLSCIFIVLLSGIRFEFARLLTLPYCNISHFTQYTCCWWIIIDFVSVFFSENAKHVVSVTLAGNNSVHYTRFSLQYDYTCHLCHISEPLFAVLYFLYKYSMGNFKENLLHSFRPTSERLPGNSYKALLGICRSVFCFEIFWREWLRVWMMGHSTNSAQLNL